jgi:hypothetical protein
MAAFVCPWVGGKKILKVSLVGADSAQNALVTIKVMAMTETEKNRKNFFIIDVSSLLGDMIDGREKNQHPNVCRVFLTFSI